MNFIQQAYIGKKQWYHYVLVFFLIFIGWHIVGVLPLIGVTIIHTANKSEFFRVLSNNFIGLPIDKNVLLLLMLTTFIVGLLFLSMGVKYIHQRPVISVITSRKKIDWNRFFTGFLCWGVIAVLFTIVAILIVPDNYVWNFKPVPFFTLVVISLLFIPLQTSFEELLFRGYLMQGLGLWFQNRWVPLLITSITFGLLHGANPEVAKLGYISMVFYIGTGLFFGIVTLMDEGTELALGLHAINNIVAAVLVTTDWTVFQTDALYIDTSEPSVGLEMFLPVFVLYPLMIAFFAKKYKWNNWKEKLMGAVKAPLLEYQIDDKT